MLDFEQVDQGNGSDQEPLDFVTDYSSQYEGDFGLAIVPNPKPHFTRTEAGLNINRDNLRWSADPDGITRVTYAFRSTSASEYSSSFTRFREN